MSRLDDLPPDQNAALSLILRERKTYAELATLLGISERAVHDRAHAALAVLAPGQARELPPERRAEIGDYMLGAQASVSERIRTRAFLASSPPASAWASALAVELAPLAGERLPEIPAAENADADTREPSTAAAANFEADPRVIGSQRQLPSSRVGGALLLAAIVAGVVVAIVLITGGGSSKHPGASASAPSTSGTSSSSSSSTSTRAKEDRRIALSSPNPASKAIGVAEVLSEGNKYAFYLAAEHLPPSKGFFYAVWLYNSPTSHEALSRSPAVGSDGRLQGGALLPSNAGNYHEMLLTRETNTHPTQPGPTVLSGAFGLH